MIDLSKIGNTKTVVLTREDADAIQQHIKELEVKLAKQNTFWACKDHKLQSTLRCAICDEERIKELEDQLTEAINWIHRDCPWWNEPAIREALEKE